MAVNAPGPGDFAVIDTLSPVSPLIQIGQRLSGGGFSYWDHAVICSRILPDGTAMIVEAEPGGAREVPWHYQDVPHRWSTGIVKTSPRAGEAARRYVGTGYSAADYLAIALHAWHIPAPGLRGFIASSHRLICSQLVDLAEQDAGVQLFDDGRWPGYVRPSDLGWLVA